MSNVILFFFCIFLASTRPPGSPAARLRRRAAPPLPPPPPTGDPPRSSLYSRPPRPVTTRPRPPAASHSHPTDRLPAAGHHSSQPGAALPLPAARVEEQWTVPSKKEQGPWICGGDLKEGNPDLRGVRWKAPPPPGSRPRCRPGGGAEEKRSNRPPAAACDAPRISPVYSPRDMRLRSRDMRLRSGRRLVSPPLAPQCRRRRRLLRSSEDRINSLPDDLLLQVTCPRLELLDIGVSVKRGAQVSSLLRAATPLAQEKLILWVWDHRHAEYDSVELPCLDRTFSLALELMCLHLMPPPSGEFTALKSLSLEWCCIDIGALLLLCPSLRVLKLRHLVQVDTLIVHSLLLEKFSFKSESTDICRIDIAAPVLKEVTLEATLAKEFSLSYSAPMVKMLDWICQCYYRKVGVNGLWILDNLRERKEHDLHVLSLDINCNPWSIAQMIAQLPVAAFSVMELDLETKGHTFGPLVLHLLGIRPVMQRLKGEVSCPVNCSCEQSSNWRSETIFLPNLEVVEIHGLQGEDDEIDFLKLMLRSAVVLRRLSVKTSNDVLPSDNGYKKICRITKEYPDVEYYIA